MSGMHSRRDHPRASITRRLTVGFTLVMTLVLLGGGLGVYLGERYSLADISLYAYTHVAQEGEFDLEPYPGIRAWLERVAAQPGHIPIDG